MTEVGVAFPVGPIMRAAVGALAARRPVFDLGGPVVEVRTQQFGGRSALRIVGAGGTGIREVVVVDTPPTAAAFQETFDFVGEDPTTVVVLVNSTDRGPDEAIRYLAQAARATSDPDDFVASVQRTGESAAGAAARRLLADLLGPEVTTARRRHVHARLRRTRSPRRSQLDMVCRGWPSEPVLAARAGNLFDRALRDWPSVDIRLDLDEAHVRPTEQIFAVPGLACAGEELTRIAELESLTGLYADLGKAVWAALVADGGMGKSSLAARLCRETPSRYQVVGWLSATEANSWAASVELLLARLGVQASGSRTLFDELARRTPALIVIDDAAEPDALRDVVPVIPGLHILVTSQSPLWRSVATVIELGPLPQAEAIEFLLARTGASDERLAATVAAKLHGYPLALDQAAATIADGVSLTGWLSRYGSAPVRDNRSLQDVWQVRLAMLREQHPDALAVLRAVACAGFGDVPVALIEALGTHFVGSPYDDPALHVCGDRDRRDAALSALRQRSLVRTGVDTETVRVHPLLAELIRADPALDVANVSMLVAAACGRLLEDYDVDAVGTRPIVSALVGAAVAACRTVLSAAGRFPADVPPALADHALWAPASYLHGMGAAQQAYQVRLLALALHGDLAAATAVQSWSGEVSDAFRDLRAEDVVPADQLGGVAARIPAARWLNENASLLTELDLTTAERYARRALALVPRASTDDVDDTGLPWAVRTRVEVLDNLGFVEVLQERYTDAVRTFNRAIRLRARYPGASTDGKFGELLNDRALALMDVGLPREGLRDVERAAAVVRAARGPDDASIENIENNMARLRHELWHLRSASVLARAGLERLWDRLDPRDTSVVIQQCNAGLVSYDLGSTEESWLLVEGAYRTLTDRYGADHRESVIRRVMLASLQLFRGDLRNAHAGYASDIPETTVGVPSSWEPVRRLQCAWLSGVAALTPETARQLTDAVIGAWQGRGTHVGNALDFRCAHMIGGSEELDVRVAVQAEAHHARTLGRYHPRTLMATARRALIEEPHRPLTETRARRLLRILDSATQPGAQGFDSDLRRAGQPTITLSRPAWEADRLYHCLGDDTVDLDEGERLIWLANAGRLAALGGRGGSALLRDAAAGSAALFGPYHPWSTLRQAVAAVSTNDRDQLSLALIAPVAF